MGKGSKEKVINVYCRDGHLLFEGYRKVGGGKLQKLFRDEIGDDHTSSQALPTEAVIYCPECEPSREVAVVTMIHGRVAYRVKRGGTRKVVT